MFSCGIILEIQITYIFSLFFLKFKPKFVLLRTIVTFTNISCPSVRIYIRKTLKKKYRFLAQMEVQVETPCFLVQPKEEYNQFKNNKQPEVPENQTAWDSDNQGAKETWTQIGMRGIEGRQAAEQRG